MRTRNIHNHLYAIRPPEKKKFARLKFFIALCGDPDLCRDILRGENKGPGPGGDFTKIFGVLDPQPKESIVRMGSYVEYQYTLREAKQIASDPALKHWLGLLFTEQARSG